MEIVLREKTENDNPWIIESLRNNWGSDFIISRGVKHYPTKLDGCIIENNGRVIGICLYSIVRKSCEIVLIEVYERRKGIGAELLTKIIKKGKQEKWKRIWLITTNDNIDALKFYLKNGF